MSKFKNEHLDCVLKSHSVNIDSGKLLENYKAKNKKVKEALQKEYGDKIVKIINSGSYAKSTAINRKFDMDICVHFKKDAFKTLKEMYDSVYAFLNTTYKKEDDDVMKVRAQKVSTGLTFSVDGESLAFDVTPGREPNDDKEDHDIYIYINNNEAQSTRKKTNIYKQIEHIKKKDKERECIKQLKVWKHVHKFDIKSFFVELLVIKAFDDNDMDSERGLWNRLEKTMIFIRDKIETIRLIDPGNSSNVVSDTLSSTEKTDLKEELDTILKKIEKDENKIKHYFPINPAHPCPTDSDKYAKPIAPAVLNKQTFG